MSYEILCGNSVDLLKKISCAVDMTFLDPPFNQQKDYALHDDDMPEEKYWEMMKTVCQSIYNRTNKGGCIYFMQREKNTEFVLRVLRETNWEFQNLIIWKKRTSAVPVKGKYGKQYQIIVYATKGERAKTFHRLRIDPELPPSYKYQRENGVFVTDIWDDIRELTSGYFAGNEALRTADGERFHKQQTPLALLLRMILTSTNVGDTVLDPFAGTGTTSVVATQIQRNSIAIEIDPNNIKCIKNRLNNIREADLVHKYYQDYICTENLSDIWGDDFGSDLNVKRKQSNPMSLFNAVS
ncbi:MAG: site-specific DNA-methyltransferase [Planctomycetaceae bacterium]|jgi:DNA modification methylase|nr:site-specific DNA-methyltransferase [Planctomycetaceae bacterium]